MKRTLLLLLLVLSASIVGAVDIPSRVWRSSFTASNDYDAFVASGTIYVIVDVQTAGTNSSIQIYDGTGSTSTARLKQDIDTTNNSPRIPFVVEHSSGLIYKNSGDTPAKVRILWDWVTTPQPGHKMDGK